MILNLDKKVFILTAVLLFVVLGTGLLQAGEREVLTVTDSDGYEVEIVKPVEEIVVTSSAINEILVALGVEDKIVGRDEWSDVSSVLEGQKEEVPVVAESSFRLQIEAIAGQDPDIVIADTMLQNEARDKLAEFDIPALGERTSRADNLFSVIRRLAKIVDREERGEEIISYLNDYRSLIEKRTTELTEEEKPLIFWEWREAYKSGNASSTVQPRIELAAGINLAEKADGTYPNLSAEYVIEQNPEVIIRQESRGTSREALREKRKEIMDRTGLEETAAVREERVYLLTQAINTGLGSVVADLYFARIAHPELFADIKPEEIYAELTEEFFEQKVEETILYPGVEVE